MVAVRRAGAVGIWACGAQLSCAHHLPDDLTFNVTLVRGIRPQAEHHGHSCGAGRRASTPAEGRQVSHHAVARSVAVTSERPRAAREKGVPHEQTGLGGVECGAGVAVCRRG